MSDNYQQCPRCGTWTYGYIATDGFHPGPHHCEKNVPLQPESAPNVTKRTHNETSEDSLGHTENAEYSYANDPRVESAQRWYDWPRATGTGDPYTHVGNLLAYVQELEEQIDEFRWSEQAWIDKGYNAAISDARKAVRELIDHAYADKLIAALRKDRGAMMTQKSSKTCVTAEEIRAATAYIEAIAPDSIDEIGITVLSVAYKFFLAYREAIEALQEARDELAYLYANYHEHVRQAVKDGDTETLNRLDAVLAKAKEVDRE